MPTRTRRHHRAATIAALVVLALTGACSTPEVETPATDDGGTAEPPLAAATPDPARDRLLASLGTLAETLADARDALVAVETASSHAAARASARTALAALAGDGGGRVPTAGPVFPTETQERDAAAVGTDQLTRTLTAARDAGSFGNEVLDLLRDPLAGDLGAWQRDAAGMHDLVASAIATAGGLDALDGAINGLPGLGTRAVAWSRAAVDARGLDDAVAYAERGAANLDVVLLGFERILTAASG